MNEDTKGGKNNEETKKVISLTVVTAIMAASMDMGNVQVAENLEMESVETTINETADIPEQENIEITASEPIQSAASDFQIENGVLIKYLGSGGDVVIPDGVTSIGNSVFSGCSDLNKLTFAGSVESIGYSAFNGCTNLRSIEIPDGVTNIENNAFYGCTSLENVKIPETVDLIGWGAFGGTLGLKNQKGPLVIVNNILVACKGEDEKVIIPDGVKVMGTGCFEGCTHMKSIEIPPSVNSIQSAVKSIKVKK